MHPRLKPLAALLPIVFSSPLHAESQTTLDPVMVTATRQAMRTSELLSDVSVVERNEIERAGHSSLGDILSRQPGIEFSTNGPLGGTGSVFTRGTNSGHTLVLIDGMRVGSATLGQMSSWARIPASQIDRVEILRGPASSLYGSDAIGGVIQIFTRQGDGPFQINAEAGAGSYKTTSATAGFSARQENWRYALNAGMLRTDGFSSIRNPNSSAYNADRDGYDDKHISGSLAYSFAKGHEVGVNAFYSDGESQYDGGFSRTSSARDYRNQLAVSNVGLYLKNAITNNWSSTLRVGHSTDDSKEIVNGNTNGLFRTDQQQYAWQNDIKTGLGTFLAGIERLDQRVSGSSGYTVDERTIDSVLAGWSGSLDAHRLQANLRYDDNSQFGSKTTGAIAYGYRFTPNWRANLGYGTAFKAPSFNDLYYPLTFGSFGNPNLKPESSRNREAAIHFETGSHHASATWFLNQVENLISWNETSPGSFAFTPSNVGKARLEGITLAYESQIGGFDLQGSYTHLDPKDRETGKLLPRRAKNYGTASLGQQLGAWDWRLEFQASDSRYNNLENTRKMSGYGLTHLYGAYKFARDWSVFARLNNLFDREYELVSDYGTPGRNAFVGIRYSPK